MFEEKSRLKSLLEHFALIPDPREPWRVAHPLAEVLLLVDCGTMADCDDYEAIAAWGAAHEAFLRRYLPYHHGVPSGRWLTLLMNRINPALFSAVFAAWVRATWPDRPELIAIDGPISISRSNKRRAARSESRADFAARAGETASSSSNSSTTLAAPLARNLGFDANSACERRDKSPAKAKASWAASA